MWWIMRSSGLRLRQPTKRAGQFHQSREHLLLLRRATVTLGASPLAAVELWLGGISFREINSQRSSPRGSATAQQKARASITAFIACRPKFPIYRPLQHLSVLYYYLSSFFTCLNNGCFPARGRLPAPGFLQASSFQSRLLRCPSCKHPGQTLTPASLTGPTNTRM